MNRLHLRDHFLRLALILLGFVCAILPDARAASQPDWLKQVLAAPAPENKRAANIMLLDYGQYTYLPQGKVHKLVRGVVKILHESGLAEARTRLLTGLWYNPDTDRVIKAHAWIVSADGKHTKSHGKGDFIDGAATISQYIWNDRRIISFVPSADLEVGGIIAWEYEVKAESGIFDSNWDFQNTMPVVKSLFEVIPCPGGTLISHVNSSQIPAATADTAPGSLKWEMSNIPGTTGELPSGFIPKLLGVSVRCVSPDNLANKIQTWIGFASLAADIIDPRTPASTAVAEKAASLVKGKTDRWDRIRAITEFVQKAVTYFSIPLDKDSLAGYRPHTPDEVMQCRLGDCKDKATLVVSMLRSIDEKAYVVLLYNGNPTAVDPDWPSVTFNHAIMAIAAGESVPSHWPQIDGGSLGKLVLFDATDEDTPLGVLPESDQGGFGVIVAKTGPGLVKFPLETPDNKKITRHIIGTVSADGDLLAEMEETLTGSSAGQLHAILLKLGNEKFTRDVMDVMFRDTMPLVKDLTWKESWDQANSQSRLTVHFAATQYARRLSEDLMMLCPHLFNHHTDYPLWKTKIDGIAWLVPKCIHEEVRLHLPEGFIPEDLPSAWHQELTAATASVQYRMEGLDLVYECKLEQKGGAYNKDDYESLRAFYQKLSEAERRPIVLHCLTKTAKSE